MEIELPLYLIVPAPTSNYQDLHSRNSYKLVEK